MKLPPRGPMGMRWTSFTMLRRGSTRRTKTPKGNSSIEFDELNSCAQGPLSPRRTLCSCGALAGAGAPGSGIAEGRSACSAARMLTGRGASAFASVITPTSPLAAICAAAIVTVALPFAP